MALGKENYHGVVEAPNQYQSVAPEGLLVFDLPSCAVPDGFSFKPTPAGRLSMSTRLVITRASASNPLGWR